MSIIKDAMWDSRPEAGGSFWMESRGVSGCKTPTQAEANTLRRASGCHADQCRQCTLRNGRKESPRFEQRNEKIRVVFQIN